jgi:signal transduction histidine kinase/FixJ family two-component response regulator/HPt (histidine-containing phosphotransfer) domain-containing protein
METAMSIRLKIALINAGIAVAITIVSFATSLHFAQENLTTTVEKDIMAMCDIAEGFMAAKISLLKADANLAAKALAGAFSEEEIREVLKDQFTLYKEFAGLTLFDSRRRIAFYGDLPTDESRIRDDVYLQQGLEGKTVISSTRFEPNSGEIVVHICAPVSPGRVLSVTLRGYIFSDMLEEFTLWKSGNLFMLDEEGTIIASKFKQGVLERKNFIEDFQKTGRGGDVAAFTGRALSEQAEVGYFLYEPVDGSEEKPHIGAFRRIKDTSPPWAIGIKAPFEESPAANIKEPLLSSAGRLLLLFAIIVIVTSYFLAKPFETIRRQNRNLHEMSKTALRASKTKSRFLANMSHEMRTPMNAIIGLSELTLALEALNAEARENLTKIHRAGLTLLGLVNDILDLSKIEAGRFELVPVDYDTPSLINDTVIVNYLRIEGKPIKFTLEIDENLPGRLFGDDLRVKQICNNLLSNAFKYTDKGWVVWSVSHERDGENVWLTFVFRDSGIGIRREDMAKLFSDYTQVDMKSNRKIQGTGLGLSLTKRLVESMDGTISLESEYGKGTAFTVRLRQKFITDVPIGPEVAEQLRSFAFLEEKLDKRAALERCRLPYARVLVVDDVQTNLDVARGMLKPYGMQVDCLTSGHEAARAVREEKVHYNAIFMDHMMPIMDGIETTRVIREEIGTPYAKTVPIIALTANALVGNEEIFLGKGFQSFLSKPIDVLRLDAVIRRWVRDEELEKELEEEEQRRALHDKRSGGDRRAGGDRRGAPPSAPPSPLLPPLPPLPPVDGIDLEQCLQRFQGDREAFLQVLASYTQNTPPLLEALRACGKDRLPDYAMTAHGIKGSSLGICAEQLGVKAAELEKAAREGDVAYIGEHGESFIHEAETLIAGLRGLLESAKPPRPRKPSPDAGLLDKIRRACAAFDMDGLDEAMSGLEAFDYESGGDLVAWLRARTDEGDFQEIADRLHVIQNISGGI